MIIKCEWIDFIQITVITTFQNLQVFEAIKGYRLNFSEARHAIKDQCFQMYQSMKLASFDYLKFTSSYHRKLN